MKNAKCIVRDAFVFYRSFKEAMDEVDDVTKLSVYEAITYYALDGVILDLKGCAKALFTLIKPQIDANSKK